MTFAYASNAMAGFMIASFTFNQSPWDRFLAGDDNASHDRSTLRARRISLTLKRSGSAITERRSAISNSTTWRWRSSVPARASPRTRAMTSAA